eukprot:SAG31_NODE_362_length_16904_cov_7.893218_18_plen_297_part_01
MKTFCLTTLLVLGGGACAAASAAPETTSTAERVGSADFPIGWWSGDITCKNASRCEQNRPTSVLGSRGPAGLLTGAENAVLNYWHVGYPDRHGVAPINYTAADYRQYLDICEAHQVACMLGLPQALVHAGETDWIVRTMVAPLANHSGLLGWYLYDEPWLKPPGPAPPANPALVTTKQLSAVAAAIRAVDGGRHLVVPCLARHWVGSPDFVAEQKGVYRLSDFADRVMYDYYASSTNRTDRDQRFAGLWNSTSTVGLFARRQHAERGMAKPGFWMVTQAYPLAADHMRDPTPAELRY